MPSVLRGTLVLTAALAAAVMFYVGATLPPPPIALDGPAPPLHAVGAYHVHTSRSDGSGSLDDVAAAARRAGLRFVIVTDHGDGTRAPEAPAYRHDVLVIDAVEISTDGGHVVALGLTAPAPYPLAGRARDVIDDIHRLGGVAVVAHPDSRKAEQRWRGQNVPFDGLEWLNVDSEWRDESPARLAGVALRSLLRPAGAIASLFDRPAGALRRWDAAAGARPVFGLAALDAHARIGWGGRDDRAGRTIVAKPSYLAMFRTLAQVAMLERPLSGDAMADSRLILEALTGGRSFSVVRALAEPAAFEFQAARSGRIAGAGERLALTEEVTIFRVRLPNAPGARLVLLQNGQPVAAGHGAIEHSTTAAGVYRVEGMFPGAVVPWVVSNPIVIGDAPRPASPPAEDTDLAGGIDIPLDPAQWTLEKEPTSDARFAAVGTELQFDYRLAPGAPRGQYAALVNAVRREASVNRVQFTARASAPMRISVQVRLPGGRDGERWRHSVFVDTTPRPLTVRLADFEAADVATSRRPFAAPVQALLFVVDTINTTPGTSGTLWISDVRMGLSAMVGPPSLPEDAARLRADGEREVGRGR